MSDLDIIKSTLDFCWGFVHYEHVSQQADAETCATIPCPSIRQALEAVGRLRNAQQPDPIQDSHEALWERAQRAEQPDLPADIGPHADGLVDAGMTVREVEDFLGGTA